LEEHLSIPVESYKEVFEEWLVRRTKGSYLGDNLEAMMAVFLDKFLEFANTGKAIKKVNEKRKKPAQNEPTLNNNNVEEQESAEEANEEQGPILEKPRRKRVKYEAWEERMMLTEIEKGQKEERENNWAVVAKCLKETKDKGRTNVDVKDWYRNYQKRQKRAQRE